MPVPIEAFKQAVYKSDSARLIQLFEIHPELRTQVNEPLFAFDSPAILQAAGGGSRPVIEALLAAGADINGRSRWWAGGFGVLDGADPEMAEYLIQRGATVDVHAASSLGMLEKLRELISAEPSLVHARGGDGKTPLHFAATVEIAEYLLAMGADMDALDIDHESTAAQHLVQSLPEIVRYLIGRGCRTDLLLAAAVGDGALARRHLDTDPKSIRMRVNEQYFPKRDPRAGGTIYIWTLGANISAHQAARKFGHPEVVELLMDRSPAEVQLIDAFAAGDEATAKDLLASHPGLMATLTPADRRQITYEAEENDTDAVRLVLEHHWPMEGGGGETPLHWAAFHGNAEMARAILKHNPPLEMQDATYHSTPLGWAIHGSEYGWAQKTGDYAGVVEALLQAGAKGPAGSEAVREAILRYRGAG